ncbi:MAG TPA: NADH-quinone oxidoreductase subunit A [Actinomycetota bacterium]|nr:NADH-quinone oxidoreductase subunit A [Actinomycetota bacterium]
MSLGSFTPILAMMVLATAFALVSIVVSAFLAPHRPTRAKYSAYESGIEPGRLPKGERFPVKFYLTAMLFVVFDVEVIFLYPWAVVFRQLKVFGLVEMGIFIGLVLVAYVYDWKRGGLEWD